MVVLFESESVAVSVRVTDVDTPWVSVAVRLVVLEGVGDAVSVTVPVLVLDASGVATVERDRVWFGVGVMDFCGVEVSDFDSVCTFVSDLLAERGDVLDGVTVRSALRLLEGVGDSDSEDVAAFDVVLVSAADLVRLRSLPLATVKVSDPVGVGVCVSLTDDVCVSVAVDDLLLV
jgi:hypothetical protein